MDVSYSSASELASIVDQVHPGYCIKDRLNIAALTPPPSDLPDPHLDILEISTLPTPEPRTFDLRADSMDRHRTAFAICTRSTCGDVYVVDNESGRVWRLRFGADPSRGLDELEWINNDTFTVANYGHFTAMFWVVDFEKRQIEYFGLSHGCPETPTP